MELEKFPLSRQKNIVVQETDNEILIYDLTKNRIFCLNETSAKVWDACNGQNSVSAIAKSLDFSEEIVLLALDQLNRENLVENFKGSHRSFKGFSRRQIIKKIGFASMTALPLVISVVAPKAINAQSECLPAGMGGNALTNACQCAANNDCISNCCDTQLAFPACAPALTCQCALESPGMFSDGCPCQNNLDCSSGCCVGVCQPANVCP
ncbi:MAG TPA: PqqD family protein [Pyrinomonadaceae bacterium]|nr:PqqD family protein [Pyrinomonadaceae bacterium]